eukprot:5899838-Pleurochrysis_carterae.AAC.1
MATVGRHRPNSAAEGLATSANLATRPLRQSCIAPAAFYTTRMQRVAVFKSCRNFSGPSYLRVAKL